MNKLHVQKWLYENIFNKNNKLNGKLIKKHEFLIKRMIKDICPFLNENFILEGIYCILHNLTDIPKCACGAR